MFENLLLKVTEIVGSDLSFVSQSALFDTIAPSQLIVCCGVSKRMQVSKYVRSEQKLFGENGMNIINTKQKHSLKA